MTDNIWKDIKLIIEDLVSKNVIACPITFQTYVELTKNDFETASQRELSLHKLSQGKAFRQEIEITYNSLDALIKKGEINHETYLMNFKKPLFAEIIHYNNLKSMRIEIEKSNKTAEKEIENIKSVQKSISQNKTSLENAIQTQRLIILQDFISRITTLITTGSIQIRKSTTPYGYDQGHYVDVILHALIYQKGFNLQDLVKLRNHLLVNNLNQIPILDIKTKLLGLRLYKNKKGNTNDLIDFKRIITGLPVSDILLTDRVRKAEIEELKLHKQYQCKIFSARPKDLILLKKELISLS